MNRQEFEQKYADESAIPIKRLESLGLKAEVCSCGDDHCEGWQMTTEFERQRGSTVINAHAGVPN